MTFCALVAVARAGVIGHAPAYAAHSYASQPISYASQPLSYAQPIAVSHQPVYAKVAHEEDYDPNPQYSFAYDVQDGLTGDSKSQHETRNGDVVTGSYSLIDADGHKRTVEYTADSHNGFNAVVHREPLVHKVAAVATPVIAAKSYAPVQYAAPSHYGYHH